MRVWHFNLLALGFCLGAAMYASATGRWDGALINLLLAALNLPFIAVGLANE